MHSQGGKGIAMAETTGQREGWYYQKYLKERRYELRIHAFSWINEENWQVQKRIGNKDTIAWNFHNGGRFQTVHNPSGYQVFQKARSIAAKVLKMRKMAFGAVDLLLTKESKLYFLEINSAPGFTELSRPIYVNAFQALMKMKKTELELLTR
jgi:glutathione synthase/RimK-type ligase-like ATP-grasp enzyme